MRKLLFGKPVETQENTLCDFCDEKKECFIGLTRKIGFLVTDTATEFCDVGTFLNPRYETIVKDFDLKEESQETTFHICPDCVKQLNSFIKEIK